MGQRKTTNQQVRIIGGKYKGRKLRFQGDASLRPTLGRTRETLFNWLRPHIAGTHCADLYAGSGALGFEALSQGAEQVTLLEKSGRTVRSLQNSADTLQLDTACRIIKTDALAYLNRCSETFDIAFIDPPFEEPQLIQDTVQTLLKNKLVNDLIYIEAPTLDTLSAIEEKWDIPLLKDTKAGDTVAGLFSVAT